MARYLVTMSPKRNYRAGLSIEIMIVEAESANKAIEKSSLTKSVEYKKPVAQLASFDKLFRI